MNKIILNFIRNDKGTKIIIPRKTRLEELTQLSSLAIYNSIGEGTDRQIQWRTEENQKLVIQPAAYAEWYRSP